MSRCGDDMVSPSCMLALLAALHLLAHAHGGPLGPLPNVTSAHMGHKEGTCAVGDVVYQVGQEFPGTGACERCTCGRGGVTCARAACQPRPGCKALHRPDQCCPIYQCECEQAGRVYGNGEKLVDPEDPCRVCYCQGGEVVCRRIACFVRDDCTPRLVPGRCCPEYDNCPLRGVTSLPSMTVAPSIAPIKLPEPAPLPPKDDTPKITIKEITPVSEIPITTDVKIKEILPSPSIEVAEYSSSKSPPITREATSEKSESLGQTKPEPEMPSVVEIHSTEMTSDSKPTDESKGADDMPPSKISLSTQDSINTDIYPSNVPIVAMMGVPANIDNSPVLATETKAPVIEEDDSSLFVEHNPFPPLPDDLSVLSNHGDEIVPEPSADTDQIPIEPAPTPEVIIASVTPLTEFESKAQPSTTLKYFPDKSATTTEKVTETTTSVTVTPTVNIEATSTTEAPALRENPTVKLRSAIPSESITASSEVARNSQEVASSTTVYKEALSTITSTAASSVTSTTTPATVVMSTTRAASTSPVSTVPTTTEAATAVTSTTTPATTVTSTTTAATTITYTSTEATEPHLTAGSSASTLEPTVTSVAKTEGPKSIEDISIEFPVQPKKIDATEESKVSKKLEALTEDQSISKASEEVTTDDPETVTERVSFSGASDAPESHTTFRLTDVSITQQSSTSYQEQTTSSIAKSNAATEVTLQTELSSLPVETSDQNPHDISENVSKETPEVSSDETFTTANKFASPSAEVITVSKANENGAIDNVETTEFVLTSFGSSESATDAVELIKISGDSEKHAAIIDHSDRNKNALTDLIRLVSDVASISDHTEAPATLYPFASTAGSDSEELIPVNAGYKSKNSNFNQNSITEVPSFKSKSGAPANKQKVVEIEDEEDGGLTDPPPPHDKAEPTTHRPIIDNVTDEQGGERHTDNKDIDIITQSYVPTLSRRPPRVEAAPDQSAQPAPLAPAAPQ